MNDEHLNALFKFWAIHSDGNVNTQHIACYSQVFISLMTCKLYAALSIWYVDSWCSNIIISKSITSIASIASITYFNLNFLVLVIWLFLVIPAFWLLPSHLFLLLLPNRNHSMSTAQIDSPSNFIKNIFTAPTSRAFHIWVSVINFWIFVSCMTLAGETI